MGVLDAMSSSNLKPEDESEEQQNRVYRTTYMFSATMPQVGFGSIPIATGLCIRVREAGR